MKAVKALLLAAMLFPSVALACPYCAARDDGGRAQTYLLGSMILFPFGVAWVVRRVLARAEAEERAEPGGD